MTTEQRELMEQGYTFSGAYNWQKDVIKKEAAELRKEGHKARITYTPGSKYSRSGSGGGWSIYWIESEASKEAKAAKRKAYEIYKLEQELVEIEARQIEIEAKLTELKETK